MPESRPRSELLQRVLSGSAALVAVSALVVSMYQTKIMRDQQKMSAWPYVHMYNSNARGSQLYVHNVGLGPALVRSVEMTLDGRPVRSWRELLRGVAGPDTMVAPNTVTTDVGTGTVLLPGNAVETFRIDAPSALVHRFDDAAKRDRLVRRICYCSLYEDCWIADSHATEPVPVRACAVDSAREFRN